jgi:2'-5' RNA ligase
MKKIRAFIAISLPIKVARALGRVSQILAEQVPPKSVRWVTPDRIHLTLRFLGNIDEAKVAAIATELDKVAAEHRAFTLYLDELGSFPNRKRPRVIWVGLEGEEDRLQTLRKAIDTGLIRLGWEPEDRPFRAHLTLGRVKDARKLRGVE